MPFGIFSDDPADYVNPDRPDWRERRGPPMTLSSAFGGIGFVIGLILGWTTDLREAPAALVGAVGGMLIFDFYWRWIKDTLPLKRR
ncbi:MAG: hypothetical protein ACPGYP_00770 [Solirubrobacterales bacterium]